MKTTKTAAEINAIMQELAEYSAMQDATGRVRVRVR